VTSNNLQVTSCGFRLQAEGREQSNGVFEQGN
jgi:hypothetical protein